MGQVPGVGFAGVACIRMEVNGGVWIIERSDSDVGDRVVVSGHSLLVAALSRTAKAAFDRPSRASGLMSNVSVFQACRDMVERGPHSCISEPIIGGR